MQKPYKLQDCVLVREKNRNVCKKIIKVNQFSNASAIWYSYEFSDGLTVNHADLVGECDCSQQEK